jgi:hypothetical protein
MNEAKSAASFYLSFHFTVALATLRSRQLERDHVSYLSESTMKPVTVESHLLQLGQTTGWRLAKRNLRPNCDTSDSWSATVEIIVNLTLSYIIIKQVTV